jgi:threonine dehydratase
MKTHSPTLSLADVEAARARISGGIRCTPCQRMPDPHELGGIDVWLKREDLQRTRSFKERGALNGLLSLGEAERARGIVAASAGNHALGLAYHGSRLRIGATVVMPVGASAVKVSRCRSLGAEVVLHGEDYDAAQKHASTLAEESGRSLVHPFDSLSIIGGQGTMALEIVEALAQFDAMVVPVGGGGLLAGIATVVKALRPEAKVIAVQAESAPGFLAACRGGRPVPVSVRATLADGIAVARVGSTSFAIAAPLVDEVVTVSELEIAAAMALLARNGIVSEGAGAVALAAVLSGRISAKSVVVPVSGGNVEPRLHEHAVAMGADAGVREFTAA